MHLHAHEAQGELFTYWRYHAFITNRSEAMHLIDSEHRQHAVVELVIRDLNDQALAHFPSGHYSAHSARTVIACLAHSLSRWTLLLGLTAGEHGSRVRSIVTSRPSGQPFVDRVRERVDVFLGFDPGLNQLVIATGVMAGIAVTIGLVYVFVQVTHAMWIESAHGVRLSASALAQLQVQHHAGTLAAMLVGGLIGMLAAFTIAETDPRQLAVTMAVGPIPMLATIALARALKGERTIGIAVMAVVMGIGTWLRKLAPWIGARAFFLGQLMFVGYLVGFLSGGAIRSSQLGWIAATLWFAATVNLALKLLVFTPLARGALDRTTLAFFARARQAIIAAGDLYETRSESPAYRRARRRLDRRLTRLNEAALLINGLLAEHAEIAHETHARLFDTELTVQNIGRLSEVLFDAELPAALQQAIANSLADLRAEGGRLQPASLVALLAWSGPRAAAMIGALDAGRVARLATALVDWRLALARWQGELVAARQPVAFESPVYVQRPPALSGHRE